jgi:hypothetical protein
MIAKFCLEQRELVLNKITDTIGSYAYYFTPIRRNFAESISLSFARAIRLRKGKG